MVSKLAQSPCATVASISSPNHHKRVTQMYLLVEVGRITSTIAVTTAPMFDFLQFLRLGLKWVIMEECSHSPQGPDTLPE
eukprot:6121273-Amphidinium_carterae.1